MKWPGSEASRHVRTAIHRPAISSRFVMDVCAAAVKTVLPPDSGSGPTGQDLIRSSYQRLERRPGKRRKGIGPSPSRLELDLWGMAWPSWDRNSGRVFLLKARGPSGNPGAKSLGAITNPKLVFPGVRYGIFQGATAKGSSLELGVSVENQCVC